MDRTGLTLASGEPHCARVPLQFLESGVCRPAPGCRAEASAAPWESGAEWPVALADFILLMWGHLQPSLWAARKRVTSYRLPALASVWEAV